MSDELAEEDLQARTFNFARRLVGLCQVLEQGGGVGRILGTQLLRTGTAVGANVAESAAANGRAEYLADIAEAGKQARETRYWLKLLVDADVIPISSLDGLLEEIRRLEAVLSKVWQDGTASAA